MRVLVTGAAGLIGSRLAVYLKKQGHDVVGVDPKVGPQVNRKGTAAKECFGESYDSVIHAGAMVDVEACEKDPLGAWQSNVVESVELARKVTATRSFVYINSIASQAPGFNAYGRAKAEADWLLSRMHLPYASIMLCNAFGVSGDGVISKFLFTKEPVIFGDGTQLREFIFVDDAVKRIAEIALKPELGVHRLGGFKTTVNELAKMVKRDIPHTRARPFEIHVGAVENPTWQAKTTLKRGIQLMIQEAEEMGLEHYFGKGSQ